MCKKTILNLILTTVIIAGLLTPATAQTPPPQTPVVLDSGSQPDGKGMPTPTPAPVLDAAAAPRTEPTPGVRPPISDEEAARIAMEDFLRGYARREDVERPALSAVVTEGNRAYGMAEWGSDSVRDSLLVFAQRQEQGVWQVALPDTLEDANWCNLLPKLYPGTSTQIVFENMNRVSPDGYQVSCVTAKNLGLEESIIWVSDIAGAGWRQIPSNGRGMVTNPIWSPDSRQLAYLKVVGLPPQPGSLEAKELYELWTILDDGTAHKLVSDSVHPSLGYGGQTDAIFWQGEDELVAVDYSHLVVESFSLNDQLGVWNLSDTEPFTLSQGIFPLAQPSDVPYLNQCDLPWGPEDLGTCSSDICYKGCAITSIAMVFKYFGVDTNPLTLNNFLKEDGNQGYSGGCEVIWRVADDQVKFAP